MKRDRVKQARWRGRRKMADTATELDELIHRWQQEDESWPDLWRQIQQAAAAELAELLRQIQQGES